MRASLQRGRGARSLAWAAVPSRDYHESLWQAVPVGLAPADFALRRRFLLDRVRAGQQVLDVGCGEGAFAAELLGAGARVVAVDVAEEPLRRARARHPELDLRLIDGEGEWQLEDASFDVLWAGEVIEHVADTARWFSEARRVLRSGGSLLLSTPAHPPLAIMRLALSGRSFATHFEPRADHLRFYSRATLSELVGEFGFQAPDGRPVVEHAGGPPWLPRLLLAHGVRSRF
jgi:2-polyprenyl-3-methyl-5-hydroxy-6-metoxy-1,4-benzoquinol methylase